MASSAVISRIQNIVSNCKLHRHPETCLVYFSNPQTGREFYFESRIDNQPIECFVPITYNGMPIMLDKLDENTEATIKIEKKVISKVDVTYLRERKSMVEIYKEGFVVFAPRKFTTYLLVEENKHDPGQFLAAQTIASKCSGIRKVSTDGGKGFWIAAGLAYFEHLALDVVREDELQYFYGLLLNAGVNESDQIMSYLVQVRDSKLMRQHHQYADGTEHYQGEIIDKWHNNTDFQSGLIKGLKAITFKYAADHPDHEATMCFENGIQGFEIELKHGLETSEVAVAFAAYALPIKLVVYSLDSNNLRQSYKCDPSHGKLTYIRLLKQYDAYYILYTEGWLNIEGYNVYAGRRERPAPFDSATVDGLYYKPKNDRFQLQESATKEKYDEALATLNRQAEIIHGAESFIISTFNTMKRRPLPDANLFDNDLLTSTYVLKGAYKKLLAQLSTLPPEAEYATQGLLTLEASGVLNDLQVVKRCDRCQNAISDAVLKCGHGVCKGCFFERVTELRRDKGYAIEPSGEAVRELTCPILDCQDFDPIPTRVLQELLGDQLDAYMEEAERVLMTRKCPRCAKVSELSKFLVSSCGCRICVYCQLELAKTNYGICMCGVAFDAKANIGANNLTETCQQCRNTLWLCKDFTPVRCSGHMMCIKCLERVIKSKDERCPACYRLFAPHEIQLAQQYFRRMCDLDCGQFFDSSGALDLPCGCHYCEQCAFKRAIGSVIGNCYSCRAVFPAHLIAVFEKKLKESGLLNHTIATAKFNAQTQYQATQCIICLGMIGAAQRFVLSCNHAFHRFCVRDYLNDFVSQVVKSEIPCPIPQCGTFIQPEVLQVAAAPKDFEKYCMLLLKAKEQIFNCPNCGCGMSKGEYDFGLNTRVNCPNCNAPFCASCMQIWQDPHDPMRCKFEYVKSAIAMLEALLAAGEGSQIAQCPGCKVPCLKDDKCDHMTCLDPTCKAQWCFRCSCIRAPTLCHSNAWHRPQCKFWAQSDGSEKMEQNCPECQKLGRLCDPPRDLKVKQRFDFDEY